MQYFSNVVKSSIVIFTVSLILGAPLIYGSNSFQNQEYSIIIPDDYPTIQEGINHAQTGDNIFVRSGVYYEYLSINISGIQLIGEDQKTTIIDVNHTDHDGINITAPNVLIQGFTIQNAQSSNTLIWDQSGIEIYSSDVIITDNIIKHNQLGINIYPIAENITIINNQFFSDGIMLGNYLNTEELLLENLIHTITNNTVNDRPIIYKKNIHDEHISKNAGQIILINCSNITIQKTNLTDTDFSIILAYCSHCLIDACTILNTEGEFILFFSDNNTIQDNTICNNMHGICLDYGSHHNIIQNNTISNNYAGISIITKTQSNKIINNNLQYNDNGCIVYSYIDTYPSEKNIISSNTFQQNHVGIHLIKTKGNIIQKNTFQDNNLSATFTDAVYNTWTQNDWGRIHIFPKPIFGFRSFGSLLIPWVVFEAKN